MMKKYALLLGCVSIQGIAQISTTDSVVVTASVLKNAPIGHNQLTLDSRENSLTDVLRFQTPIVLKEYGQNMLTTLSYRGLGAAHTAIYWNGMPINSAISGVSDLSLIPVKTTDDIQLRSGSGSSNLGSGASSGTLSISGTQKFDYTKQVQVSQEIASFSTYNTRLSGGFSTDRIGVKVGINYFASENDYSYEKDEQKYTVSNGDSKKHNWYAQITYKWNDKNSLAYHTTNTFAERGLIDFYGYAPNQFQKDENQIHVLQWNYVNKRYNHQLRQGFLYNKYAYYFDRNTTDNSTGISQDYVTKYDGSYRLSKNINALVQTQLQYTKAYGNSFETPQTNALYQLGSGISYENKRWHQQVNIAVGHSKNFSIPFTFDYGMTYKAKNISAFYSLANSYRNPTFNDLYYPEVGNPNLKTENGWNTEIGYNYTTSINKKMYFNLKQVVYFGQYTDWIQWVPNESLGGRYSPINIAKVKHYGIELYPSIQLLMNKWYFKWVNSLNLSRAINRDTDQLLSYSPTFKWSSKMIISYKNHSLSVDNEAINNQYADNNENYKMPSYQLVNLQLTLKPFIKDQHAITIGCRNIFDKNNQSISGYYLAGRSYFTQIVFGL